ncbi:MAG: hypothetical protein SOT41_03595 [Candidatus Faecisoma sp.]|jgi:hypothetical protein|nr:hypothetical protein [Acholeplasma sp.]MCI5678290.1 hypothetical protein [Acholeplasma sp.]MDY2892845.1 hypothetical protein [Candidatus Faecisoma sp.]CCY27287.1 rmuC-domain protein [Acholeplasma sp. CAG:878]
MLDLIIEYRYIIAVLVLIIGLFLVMFVNKKNPRETKSLTKEEKNKELDIVLKAIEEKPAKKELSFEEEQEENAIISYQELLAAANGQKKEKVEDNNPELADLINQISMESKEIEALEEPEIIEDVVNTKEDEQKKFKNSEFISPVFGKDKPKESNDEFLQSLKDFRSNL